MVHVLDAHALLAYFEKEPGYKKVKELLISAVEKDSPLLMTSVNYGEVLYIVLREWGPQKADEIDRAIRTLPIDIVDVDIQIAKETAQIKARFKLSYAGCFAAALAKLRKGELLTGDGEFDQLKELIKIQWI